MTRWYLYVYVDGFSWTSPIESIDPSTRCLAAGSRQAVEAAWRLFAS